jgi:hypothetical protein
MAYDSNSEAATRWVSHVEQELPTPEFIPGFFGGVHVARSLCNVIFCRSFAACPFVLLCIALSVLRLTTSDYSGVGSSCSTCDTHRVAVKLTWKSCWTSVCVKKYK